MTTTDAREIFKTLLPHIAEYLQTAREALKLAKDGYKLAARTASLLKRLGGDAEDRR